MGRKAAEAADNLSRARHGDGMGTALIYTQASRLTYAGTYQVGRVGRLPSDSDTHDGVTAKGRLLDDSESGPAFRPPRARHWPAAGAEVRGSGVAGVILGPGRAQLSALSDSSPLFAYNTWQPYSSPPFASSNSPPSRICKRRVVSPIPEADQQCRRDSVSLDSSAAEAMQPSTPTGHE